MPTQPEAHIRWSNEDGVAVVEVLARELNQPAIAQEFGAQLRGLVASKAADRILVDFQRTKFMSSTAFGALLGFIRDASAAGVRVAFCGMAPAIRLGADILRIHDYVPVCEDREAGLAALGPF